MRTWERGIAPPIFAANSSHFYGGPLTSAHMAHLLFNILQPVPNLLYFWLMAGVAGLEPTDAGVKVLCLTTLAIPQ